MSTPIFTATMTECLNDLLDNIELCAGMGMAHGDAWPDACSITAINCAIDMAVYGMDEWNTDDQLSDRIPDCMSQVIGCWIRVVQDAMPDHRRNDAAWKFALPAAAATGRNHDLEIARAQFLLQWLYEKVLPQGLPRAERYGYLNYWDAMIDTQSIWAAEQAGEAVYEQIPDYNVCSHIKESVGNVARALKYAQGKEPGDKEPSVSPEYSLEYCANNIGLAATFLTPQAANNEPPITDEMIDAYWDALEPEETLHRLIRLKVGDMLPGETEPGETEL